MCLCRQRGENDVKRVPKHIISKLERMNRLMRQLTCLNVELEEWMEKNGIEDGFDFTTDWRNEPAYEIVWTEEFVRAIEEAIN